MDCASEVLKRVQIRNTGLKIKSLNVIWIIVSWSTISRGTCNGQRSTDIFSSTVNFFYHQITRNHPQKT